MSNYKDNEFDQNVIDCLSEIMPSEEEIWSTNPWKVPIDLITWGLALTMFFIKIWSLDYILPTIGAILMFLGFRSLRNENIWFKLCWILSIVRLLLHWASLLFETSPLRETGYTTVFGITSFILLIVFLLLFRIALKSLFDLAGQKVERDPLIGAFAWIAIMFFLAFIHAALNWILFIIIIISYILIFRSLFQVGDNIDDTGYRLKPAPVKVSNNRIILIYIALSILLVLASCILSNHLRVEGQQYQQPKTTNTRELLIKKGFPKDLLEYLSNQDVEQMSEAVKVETLTKYSNEIENIIKFGSHKMEAKTVFIQTKKNEIYVLQYFHWLKGKTYWQDGIQIILDKNATKVELMNSGLLYDKKNATYKADFPSLQCKDINDNSYFESDHNWSIYGAFNYPFGSRNQRGYVLYRYSVPEEPFCIISAVNYLHNQLPFNIPYFNAEDKMLNDSYSVGDKWQQYRADYNYYKTQ